MQFCPHCGAQNSASAKFCHKCGKSVSTPNAYQPPTRQGTLALKSLLNQRYLVINLLGKGGMGAVYLAQDQNAFNRQCVVKEMLAYYQNPTEQAKAEQDFEREARTLANLRFDGVPQVYEYFIENGRYYMVMEFVEGENLEERLASVGRALPEDEVAKYALQLANILIYLGKQVPPVIHRDIKPANIILDEDQGKVKLVDFGLAKETSGTGMTGGMSVPLGTPGYAPPEQYSGKVDPRTDVYALGATLHHLLTGRDPRSEAPFDFPPVSDLVPGTSPELEKLIAQMVDSHIGQRPTARDVRDTLEAFIHPVRLAAVVTQPFVFTTGELARDPGEFALICDTRWEDGAYHLYAGHLEPWLETQNRPDLAVRARTIRLRGGDQAAGLEEFLRAANPTIALPSLAISETRLDAGTLEKSDPFSRQIRIKNAGRGYLNGKIQAKADWAAVRPAAYGLMAGEEAIFTLSVNSATLNEGAINQAIVELTSNGGQELIYFAAEITWQPRLGLDSERLAMGDVLIDQIQPVTAPLQLHNSGGGILTGQIQFDDPWLSADVVDFSLPSGQSTIIHVTADPTHLDVQRSSGTIRIITPSEVRQVKAQVGVRKAWFDAASRTKIWLIYAPLILIGYLGQIIPVSLAVYYLFGGVLPSYWVLGGLVAAIPLATAAFHLSLRWKSQLDEIENFYHQGSLAASTPTTTFSFKKLYTLAAVGGVLGLIIGWNYAKTLGAESALAGWLLTGLVIGGLVGGLLAGMGKGSPSLPGQQPWLERLWRGPTLEESPTYISLRTLGLILGGACLGILLDRIGGNVIRPGGAILGGIIGAMVSSEEHRLPGLRVRWLLGHARVALLVGAGVVFAMTGPLLLGNAMAPMGHHPVWQTISGYGALEWSFPGIPMLIWQAFLLVAGVAGGMGALWALDGAGMDWGRAKETFLGLSGLLLVVTFPVYLIVVLLLQFVAQGALADWITLLLVSGTITAAAWALYAQRKQIEDAWRRAQTGFDQTTAQLSPRATNQWDEIRKQFNISLPAWLERVWQRLSPMLARIRVPSALTSLWPTWSPPSLAILEANATMPLVLAAAVTAVILQQLLAALIAGVAVGVGILVLYVLLAFALLIGLVIAVRYFRSRP